MPYGCYYVEGERGIKLNIRLQKDIFPLLNHLELRINKEFNLVDEELQIDAWIEHEIGEQCNNLVDLEKLCYQKN